MIWVWEHKFHTAKSILRPGILTQLIGKPRALTDDQSIDLGSTRMTSPSPCRNNLKFCRAR